MTPPTDVLVPTLWRAPFLEPFLESLHANTANVEVLFICDDDDDATINELDRLGQKRLVVSRPGGEPAGYAAKINAGYHATNRAFLFTAADDLRFTPDWLETAFGYMGDGVHVVGVNDDIPGHVHDDELPGHHLIRRSYIVERSGVVDQPDTVLHEGYGHFYSDLELWETAATRGCWTSGWESRVTHLHPNGGTRGIDRTTELTRRSLRHDMDLYQQRRPRFVPR